MVKPEGSPASLPASDSLLHLSPCDLGQITSLCFSYLTSCQMMFIIIPTSYCAVRIELILVKCLKARLMCSTAECVITVTWRYEVRWYFVSE